MKKSEIVKHKKHKGGPSARDNPHPGAQARKKSLSDYAEILRESPEFKTHDGILDHLEAQAVVVANGADPFRVAIANKTAATALRVLENIAAIRHRDRELDLKERELKAREEALRGGTAAPEPFVVDDRVTKPE